MNPPKPASVVAVISGMRSFNCFDEGFGLAGTDEDVDRTLLDADAAAGARGEAGNRADHSVTRFGPGNAVG